MRSNIIDNVFVELDGNISRLQVLHYFRRFHLLLIAIERHLLMGYGGVGNANGTGLNVIHAPHVEEVGNVVKCTKNDEGGLLIFHVGSNFSNLVNDGHSCIFHWLFFPKRGGFANKRILIETLFILANDSMLRVNQIKKAKQYK